MKLNDTIFAFEHSKAAVNICEKSLFSVKIFRKFTLRLINKKLIIKNFDKIHQNITLTNNTRESKIAVCSFMQIKGFVDKFAYLHSEKIRIDFVLLRYRNG